MRKVLLIFSILLVSVGYAADDYATNSQIMKALDLEGQKGIILVEQKKIRYKVTSDGYYVKINDDDSGDINVPPENRVVSSTASKCWWVQSSSTTNKKYDTYPVKGTSCLRSGLPTGLTKDSDAQCGILVFRVFGAGVLSFNYKTATDDGDGISVIVDGEESPYFNFASGWGFDEDTGWGYAASDTEKTDFRNYAAININGGITANGTYKGTYYHEVIIKFEKDLPKYEYNDSDQLVYVKDGPEKPVKPLIDDFKDPDDPDWRDWYDLACEEYQEELAFYESFFNCIWLDNFSWTPNEVTMEFSEGDNVILDEATVFIDSNYSDFGYTVRYTTDGTAATLKSNLYDDEVGIVVNKSCKINAAVFFTDIDDSNGNKNTTEVLPLGVTLSGEFKVKATPPVIKLDDSCTETNLALKLENAYAGNEIHYTLDGSEPNAKSKLYDSNNVIAPTSECIVAAICIRNGVEDSDKALYEVKRLAIPAVIGKNEDNAEEPHGVYSTDSFKVSASITGEGELKYGTNGTADSKYEDTLQTKSGSVEYVFQNVKRGYLPSDVVKFKAVKADKKITIGTDGSSDVNLEIGWNLIGLPFNITRASEDALLKAVKLYGKDNGRSYSRAASVAGGRAYWLFYDGEASFKLELQGAVTGEEASVSKGVNILSPVYGKTTLEKNVRAWQFNDGDYDELGASDTLIHGRGYIFKK